MEQRELTTEKKDKGFTLVELLIVIVILGILATVVVFAVANVTEKAQDNACGVEKKTIQTASESYKAVNNGDIPADFDALASYLTEDISTSLWALDAEGNVSAVAGSKCAA